MSRQLGTEKDVEKLARIARRSGFTVEVTSKNHLRWVAPRKTDNHSAQLISPLTFGDKRRIKAIKKFLVANGCEGVVL
jgi:hypothetical protein